MDHDPHLHRETQEVASEGRHPRILKQLLPSALKRDHGTRRQGHIGEAVMSFAALHTPEEC